MPSLTLTARFTPLIIHNPSKEDGLLTVMHSRSGVEGVAQGEGDHVPRRDRDVVQNGNGNVQPKWKSVHFTTLGFSIRPFPSLENFVPTVAYHYLNLMQLYRNRERPYSQPSISSGF